MQRTSGIWMLVGCLAIGLWTLGNAGCSPQNADRNDRATIDQEHADHDHGEHDHGEHDDGDHDDGDHDDDDHDHNDHEHGEEGESHELPGSLAAGIAELHQQYQAIRDAFADQDVEQAHQPLHDVGRTLEALPELANQADVSEDDTAIVQSATTAMFDAYAQVDGAIHDGEEPDYAAVSDALDKAMVELQGVLERLSEE